MTVYQNVVVAFLNKLYAIDTKTVRFRYTVHICKTFCFNSVQFYMKPLRCTNDRLLRCMFHNSAAVKEGFLSSTL